MTKPNSRTTRFRRWLSAKLRPMPDPGEAWCLDCCFNDGRTTVLPADSAFEHARRHRDDPSADKTVTIDSRWPITRPGREEGQ